MSQKQTVVISDIHMGTNEATNWYQKDIHEQYLAFILNWIITNKADVDELIILGDLFDYWTYPPDEKPPTAAQIVAANPNILGANGLLSQVLSALEGRVSYLHGNHDITTTQDDLNQIINPQYKIQLQPDIYVKNGVVYTHGHLFTMFNAPDLGGQPIPVGHFVTRAVSYYLKKNNEQAAKEPGFGVPNMGYGALETILSDLGFPGILTHLPDILNFSITEQFMDVIQKTTGIPDDYPIILERNLGTTTFAAVKKNYANLWTEWMQKYATGGDLSRGFMFSYKAAFSDYDGSYLGWSAQQLAFENMADLVVMGHTHIPKSGLVGDISNYLNSGFECVPSPDMGKDQMTYSLITTENGRPVASEVVKVTNQNGQYQAGNDNPPPANPISDHGNDDSCYITVQNKSNDNYLLVANTLQNNHGYFAVIPPSEIPANSSVKFWIQDLPGAYGSDGEVTYRGQNSGNTVPLTFRCTSANLPFNRNSCGGTSEFYSKSVSIHNNWGPKNSVAEEGNPLFVQFVIN